MNLLKDYRPEVNVSEAEYKRLLGYPYNHQLEGKARELADWARIWYSQNGNPWVYSILLDNLRFENKLVKIEDIELSSKTLYNQFQKTGTGKAVLLIASAGKECEGEAFRLWKENKPDEYFFLEIFGSAVVEHLTSVSGYFLCDWAEKNNSRVLPHYSPGYTGWRIEDQNELWKLVENYKTELPGEIDLLDSGMLNPKKSMLALFGITGQIEKAGSFPEYIPCKSCTFNTCRYRRSPYSFWRKQIEDVSSLMREGDKGNKGDKVNNYLNHNAKYSVNIKALEKWSKDRLNLKINEDGSVEGIFHYEGTTCSNLGHKLEFEYNIKLSSFMEGYPIISINCIPSDEGYQFMCGYIKNKRLLNEIINEKPLLGKTLEDVLNWKREFSPDGCYCNPESRSHKWGLVLEVLHFALVEHEKNNGINRIRNLNNQGELIID
ncbi:MAG TPA: hypothetical protein VMT35_02420 [Ignavibacteriaceae bacterium]|nr:hypothetical protein [Ignavibacteriaceae bacterium]